MLGKGALLGWIGAWLLVEPLFAGCCLPETPARQFNASQAVVAAEVVAVEPFFSETGAIRTRYTLRTIETFKGVVPASFELVSDGGRIGEIADASSGGLKLDSGRSYVLLLDRADDGGWTGAPQRAFHVPPNHPEIPKFFRGKARGKNPGLATAGSPESVETSSFTGQSGVPGSVVTATGYQQDSNGHPRRQTTCDGGEPIPYLVDLDLAELPAGMDQTGALAAVQEALNAWAGASGLTFRFAGVQSFGIAASTIALDDRVLRIQLHDNYNAVTNGALGIGGGRTSVNASVFCGGKVGSQGFQEMLSSFVVLNHRDSFMATAVNFKQVLTHELGHALGLAHSSENASEPDPILKNATMYWRASNDGRGAALTVYDQDRIAFGYPAGNLPPYTIDRLIPAVTAANVAQLPAVSGCNRLRLQAVDRENAPTTAAITVATSGSGTFALSGNVLTFTPNAYYGDAALTPEQIAGGYYYDYAFVQFSDGVNLSRAARCVVTGFAPDSTPSDGLPDSWMTTNFGTTAVGSPGSGRHPDDDPDKDGLSNRVEFYLGTNPNSAASGPVTAAYNHAGRQLSFAPVRFAPYVVEASPTLAGGSWSPRRLLTRYDASAGAMTPGVNAGAAPQAEFYRVVVRP